jgi:hypothetical protein
MLVMCSDDGPIRVLKSWVARSARFHHRFCYDHSNPLKPKPSRRVDKKDQHVRHNADAVTEIQELLADAGLSLEALTADELADRPEYLDYIERVDRLVSIAESRRNASLREIERRRAVLAERCGRAYKTSRMPNLK